MMLDGVMDKPLRAVLASTALLLTACGEPQTPPAATTSQSTAGERSTNCSPSGALQYVCGPQNAEDLVRLGESEWLIASGMGPHGANPVAGEIYLINHMTKSYEAWFPGAAPIFRHDTAMFGTCPGPLNVQNFSAHGLALRAHGDNRYRMYMTSHGEREAIEMFEIDASGAKPSIAWVGCVVLPERMSSNSVAILDDGGFVTTKMMDPTIANPFALVMRGDITGNVFEWRPGGDVQPLIGTELSGANGIELSPDQRYMFVAAIGSATLVRFDRTAKPMTSETVQLPIRPDNLRWTSAGKLYTTGGHYAPAAEAECANPPCVSGWAVIEIDPETLQVTRVVEVDGSAALQGASTALEVGNEIWIGTYNGDRVGYLPKP